VFCSVLLVLLVLLVVGGLNIGSLMVHFFCFIVSGPTRQRTGKSIAYSKR
jgi:hypothetical protein